MHHSISSAFYAAVLVEFSKKGIDPEKLKPLELADKIAELAPHEFPIFDEPRTALPRQVYRGYQGKRRSR